MYLHIIILFFIGLIFGSFFMKIGYRIPKNVNILTNSKCNSCEHELSFIEKIPIISYIIQKGRCKYCHQKISIMYPAFELLTGLLYSLVYVVFIDFNNPWFYILFGLVFTSSLIIIMITDIKYMIIPNEVLITFGILIVGLELLLKYMNEEIVTLLDAGYEIIFMAVEAVFMFLIMYLIKKIGDMLFRKESLGWGDIKLMAYIALVMGWKMSIIVIFLASFIALPLSIINAYKKNKQMLPFGPYLAVATLFLFLLNINYEKIIEFIK